MRVLVTGGAGFVGSHVTDGLLDEGHEVRVLDSLDPAAHAGTPSYLRDDVDYRFGDVTDPATVRSAVADIDAVSHQAAKVGLGVDFGDAPGYVSANDLGTATLLAALHETAFQGPLVLASSMVVYGEGRYVCDAHGIVRPGPRAAESLRNGDFEPPCPRCGKALSPVAVPESAPTDPRNVYAATKLHQEHLCEVFAREHEGISCTALRYHNVYGPRMPSDTPYAGVASIFRSALEAGRAPEVFEDGLQLRDFVHVEDVARANVRAVTAGIPGTFNIASGTAHTVLDLALTLARTAEAADADPVVTGRFRFGDVRHVFASTTHARRELGFVARVPFETGVAAFASAELRASATSR